MSFSVHFFARDYSIDGPRLRTPEEAAALTRVVTERGAAGDSDVFTDTEEASAGLSIRNLRPQHCSLIYGICLATDWIAVFAKSPEEHILLATSAFEAPEGTVFFDVFGGGAARVVGSADEVNDAIQAAFTSWRDWVDRDFDEVGRRKENRDQ